MGIVTGIEAYAGRVAVLIDGVTAFRLPKEDFQALPLSEGEDVDEEEYADRVCANQIKRAYPAALRVAAGRELTGAQLRRSLEKRGFLPMVAEVTAERLAEQGATDDGRFAARFVELNKKLGRRELTRKLLEKGIARELVEAAVSCVTDCEQASASLELARKLAPRYAADDKKAARAKLTQALARRGFSWEDIRAAVDAALGD